MHKTHLKNIIKDYIINNHKQYILITILFIIGLFVGVLIVNNSQNNQLEETSNYIDKFITNFKDIENIDTHQNLITSIKNNMILALTLWFAGTTVIGMPVVLALIVFRGLALGYTISIIVYTLGSIKGITFCIITLFLQNILLIPAILTIGVSSIKLYKSIMMDKRKENIKIEIIKHTAVSGLMITVLLISSMLENFASINILKKFIKYF